MQITAALKAGVAPGVVLMDASYGTNAGLRFGIVLMWFQYRSAVRNRKRQNGHRPAQASHSRRSHQNPNSAKTTIPQTWPRPDALLQRADVMRPRSVSDHPPELSRQVLDGGMGTWVSWPSSNVSLPSRDARAASHRLARQQP
jgi:hypothetical protein